MRVALEPAAVGDVKIVSGILQEAAAWLEERKMPLWRGDELLPEMIAVDVANGLFFIGMLAGEAVGVLRFQLEDKRYWPDVPEGESAFIHRLAVRRRFAGGDVSAQLLQLAVGQTRFLKRRFLRLDCDAARPRLRAIYERFGFQHHSDLHVPPYFVSRYEYEILSV